MAHETALAYLELPVDDRADIRMPKLLKQHAAMVAQAKGESLSELMLEALAELVTRELPAVQVWHLTAPEQAQLLRVLSHPPVRTPGQSRARKRAKALFGASAIK